MKKQLLTVALAASALLFACKKEQKSPDSSGKTYPVTISVNSGISSSASSLASEGKGKVLAAAAPAPVATKYLSVLFYDANSKLLQRIDQVNGTTSNFGTFTTNLPTGQVFIFYIASDNNTFSINLSTANANSTKLMPNGYPVMSFSSVFVPTTAIFTKSQSYTVTGPVNQTVVLTRAVSQVKLTMDDIVVSGAQFSYEEDYPLNRLDLLQQTGEYSNSYLVSYTVFATPTASQVGTAGYNYSSIVWPGTTQGISFTYTYPYNGTYTNNTKTLVARTDTLKANTKYTFEGYFGNLRQNVSTITADTTWNPTVSKTWAVHKIVTK